MIDQTLKFLANELNAYLSIKTGNENIGRVFLKPLVKQDGSLDMENDSLSLILANIEEEHAMKNHQQFFEKTGTSVKQVNPAINLNLLILFAANFTNYDEALKFLSLTILFFQHKHVFSNETHPNFSEVSSSDEITVKLQAQSMEQQNHLWGMLGAKYMPSIAFKIRLLNFREDQTDTFIPTIQTVDQLITRQ